MGQVWEARDTRPDRIVALKTSHTKFSERFERKARAAAALNHRIFARSTTLVRITVYSPEHLPRRCPAAPEGKRAKQALRHLLYGNKPHVYRVIHEIDEQGRTVHVLTIRHGVMDVALPDKLS